MEMSVLLRHCLPPSLLQYPLFAQKVSWYGGELLSYFYVWGEE